MLKEISLLLEETQSLLNSYEETSKDTIHSKIAALYLYLQKCTESNKSELVDKYNVLVKRAKEMGIAKIKRIQASSSASEHKQITETESVKKREDSKDNPKTERIAASILDYSKLLKKKAESFGQMVENSKTFIDKVSVGMRENVKQVQKGVRGLDSTEWYSLSTGQVLFLLVSSLLIFIMMYFLIRAI